MRTFIFDGMEGATDVEKRDISALQHDTGGLPGRKFVGANGFHFRILGGSPLFDGRGHPCP